MNFIQKLSRRQFIRDVATVATGTAAAQAVGMAFAPLVTRLYGPEAFGIQGIFASIVTLLSVAAALGYPVAIVLPREDGDAIGLAKLSILIATLTCLITTLALSLFGDDILILLNADSIIGFMYLIPVAMFISVVSSTLGQWLIRKKAFGVSARYVVITTFLISAVKTVVGLERPSGLALILINTFGAFIGALLTFVGWRRHAAKQRVILNNVASAKSQSHLWSLARAHYDFPLLRTPQNLINALSQKLPIFLLAFYFGSGAAGQYSIAITMLGIPASLIGGSVMAVFYPRINEAIHNRENARSLIVRATLGMASTGLLPMLAVIILGPWLFEIVFGTEWRTAGEYSQWLSIWIFLQYINKPAVSAIPALKMQGGLLFYEIFSTSTKVIALWLGFVIFESGVAAIALFSIFGSLAYIWLIMWVIIRSGKIHYG